MNELHFLRLDMNVNSPV